MALLNPRYKSKQFGILVLRIGVGIAFMLHGMPKLLGGPEAWEKIGATMQLIGFSFAPAFWGFMAGFAEGVGGLLLLLGLLFRPANVLLLITMLFAIASHAASGDGFNGYSHALEAAVLFFSFCFIGPGKYSLDEALSPKRKDRSTFKA